MRLRAVYYFCTSLIEPPAHLGPWHPFSNFVPSYAPGQHDLQLRSPTVSSYACGVRGWEWGPRFANGSQDWTRVIILPSGPALRLIFIFLLFGLIKTEKSNLFQNLLCLTRAGTFRNWKISIKAYELLPNNKSSRPVPGKANKYSFYCLYVCIKQALCIQRKKKQKQN